MASEELPENILQAASKLCALTSHYPPRADYCWAYQYRRWPEGLCLPNCKPLDENNLCIIHAWFRSNKQCLHSHGCVKWGNVPLENTRVPTCFPYIQLEHDGQTGCPGFLLLWCRCYSSIASIDHVKLAAGAPSGPTLPLNLSFLAECCHNRSSGGH